MDVFLVFDGADCRAEPGNAPVPTDETRRDAAGQRNGALWLAVDGQQVWLHPLTVPAETVVAVDGVMPVDLAQLCHVDGPGDCGF